MDGKPVDIGRKYTTYEFIFAEDETAAPQTANMAEYAMAGVHVSEELDGLTVVFSDTGPWGTHEILELPLSTGFVELEDTQVTILAGANLLSAELTTPAPAAGSVWLKVKS
jgi:hypothetical protein